MAGKKAKDDWAGPSGEGTPEEPTASGSIPNFNHERMVNFLKDWHATKVEIEKLTETHIKPLKQHISDSKKLAKEAGFDLRVMDEMLKDMALTPSEYENLETVRDLYRFHAASILPKE